MSDEVEERYYLDELKDQFPIEKVKYRSGPGVSSWPILTHGMWLTGWMRLSVRRSGRTDTRVSTGSPSVR